MKRNIIKEISGLGAYWNADRGIVTFVDGNVHLCVQNNSPSFPVLQRWLYHPTTSRHLCRRGADRRTGIS